MFQSHSERLVGKGTVKQRGTWDYQLPTGFLLTVKTGPFFSKNRRGFPKISPNRISCLQEFHTAPQKTVRTTGFLVYHAVCNSDVLI